MSAQNTRAKCVQRTCSFLHIFAPMVAAPQHGAFTNHTIFGFLTDTIIGKWRISQLCTRGSLTSQLLLFKLLGKGSVLLSNHVPK
eukprot:m.771839 g.771839  ORF g.771839 m.771839 type:complete len:85 (-) comp23246_c0_seq1:761-1015(-)